MGIGIGRCSHIAIAEHSPEEPAFIVKKRVYLNGYTVAKVWYRDATNCCGEKVIVVPGMALDKDLLEDPHFREEGGPIARFHPSQFGWDCAIDFLTNLEDGDY